MHYDLKLKGTRFCKENDSSLILSVCEGSVLQPSSADAECLVITLHVIYLEKETEEMSGKHLLCM